MDKIFSTPAKQMLRLVDNTLLGWPEKKVLKDDALSEMAAVCAALSAFADLLCTEGTCAEVAQKLQTQMDGDKAARKLEQQQAKLAQAEERRAAAAERAAAQAGGAIVLDEALDLEDSDAEVDGAPGDTGDDEWGAGVDLLSCVSLSKLFDEFIQTHRTGTTQPLGAAGHAGPADPAKDDTGNGAQPSSGTADARHAAGSEAQDPAQDRVLRGKWANAMVNLIARDDSRHIAVTQACFRHRLL